MKRILIHIFCCIAFLASAVSSSRGGPIRPYKPKPGYTVSEARNYALGNCGDPQVSSWFRANLVEIVNNGLASCGESKRFPYSKEGAAEILNESYLTREFVHDWKNYWNSHIDDGAPDFYLDDQKHGQNPPWSGFVMVFRYGRCKIYIYKTECMNLLKIPVEAPQEFGDLSEDQDRVAPPPPVSKRDTVYLSAPPQPRQDDGEQYDPRPVNSNNYHDVIYYQPQPREEEKTVVRRRGGAGWFVAAVAVAGTAAYLLLKNSSPRTQTGIAPRTGGYGTGSDPGRTGGYGVRGGGFGVGP